MPAAKPLPRSSRDNPSAAVLTAGEEAATALTASGSRLTVSDAAATPARFGRRRV
ncbi:hypothetical protein [Streptomyces sp. NPDC006668]|uniref:hypothetical protein n=1 Tax=Streptomyces sp. NPDC006668 TaxID=3156903 RepID=UPI0033CCCC96